jgi:hypothetical protein
LMGDQLKDLEKLVELKDRGALSEAEFEAQKKALLGAKPGKRWGFWRIAKWGGVGFIGFVFIGGLLNMAEKAGQTPTCDSSAAQQRAVTALNAQSAGAFALMGIGGASAAFRVHGLQDIKQLHYDAESGFRACVASTRLDTGKGVAGYTVEWVDREHGISNVAVADPSILEARYGASSPAAAPSLAEAATPQAAAAPNDAAATSTTPAPATPMTTPVSPEACIEKKMQAYDADRATYFDEAARRGEEVQASAGAEAMLRDEAESKVEAECRA